MAMQVGPSFTLLAGSQQPLGVMRTNFTHVGGMGHVLIQDIKDYGYGYGFGYAGVSYIKFS
jgi:hypothetical protein